jgi:hypothetical protein
MCCRRDWIALERQSNGTEEPIVTGYHRTSAQASAVRRRKMENDQTIPAFDTVIWVQ